MRGLALAVEGHHVEVDVEEHLAQVASDDDLERTTRDGAASVVGCIAEWKPKLLGKANLVTPVVHACCGCSY